MQNWFDPKPLQASAQGIVDGIDKVSQAWEPWWKAAARGQLEAISLASRRMQAYLELPARLAACKTPQDLGGEQLRFWQSAAEQYAESYGRVAEAYRGLTPVAWSFLQAAAGTIGGDAGDRRQRDYMSVRERFEAEEDSTPDKGSRRAA